MKRQEFWEEGRGEGNGRESGTDRGRDSAGNGMVKGGQLRKCRFFFSARCRPQCLCKFFSVGQLSQKRLSIFCCCYCCCCCFCFCCCISSSWLLWLECFKESTCCPAIIGCQCIILNFFLVVLFRFVVAIISSQFLKIELLLSMLVVFFSFCFY